MQTVSAVVKTVVTAAVVVHPAMVSVSCLESAFVAFPVAACPPPPPVLMVVA